jgi:hypothetical protein
MKKSCLFALLFSCIGTMGVSQSIDVSTLSEYEKKIHRIGYCEQLDTFALDGDIQGLDPKKVYAIYNLLIANKFLDRDTRDRKIFRKIQNDMKKQMILEEISFTQTDVDMCENDLKAILKDEYIPNFSYMEK